jgi:hypothetical protein
MAHKHRYTRRRAMRKGMSGWKMVLGVWMVVAFDLSFGGGAAGIRGRAAVVPA